MAISSTSSRRFSRAMALAIATGITLTGGVQIVNDTHVANAATYDAETRSTGIKFDSPENPDLVLAHKPQTNKDGNIIGTVILPIYDSAFAQSVGPSAIKYAGLDLNKPVTLKTNSYTKKATAFLNDGQKIELTAGEQYDLSNLNHFEPRPSEPIALSQEIDGKTHIVYFTKYKDGVSFPTPNLHLSSGVIYPGKSVTMAPYDQHPVDANVFSPILVNDKSVLPPTNQLKFGEISVTTDNNNTHIDKPGSHTPGFTYTAPEGSENSTVKLKFTATWDRISADQQFFTPDGPTRLRPTAEVIYTVKVGEPPENEINGASITIKDNGDGTFTFNSGEEGAEDITINTKDGVQDVIKQDNTLVFTMADGSTKNIDVAANITLKQNNNGTATISDGKTTLTVATANTYLDKVEKNAKGDYVLTRNDNQTFTVNLQDIRNDIAALKIKDSPSRAEHKAVEDKVDNLRKQLNEFANSNSDSLEELADQIDALGDKVDANAKEFKRELTNINTGLQDLEFRIERTENRLIKEVRDNHDGTFTLVTEKHGDIKGNIDVSSGVTNIISNSDGTITLEFAGKPPHTVDLHQVEVTETGKGTPEHTITIKVPGEEPFRFNAFDTYVTNIETDNKGKYTLKLSNGETVTGVIDTSKTIKSIENRSDGSIVLVRTDGTKSKPIKLEQVKITEANKGTPEHTVTIAVPGGETVTLDAYDNFVTAVTKKSDGIYEIKRNDGQSWKINITDLYKRVADLEAKDSPTRDEFNAVKKDIADYKKLVDKRFTAVEGDVAELREDLTAVEKRVTVLEARVDRIDNVLTDLAKCDSAQQIASIPAVLSVALFALSQAHLPGVEAMNTQIQKQIGIYNANAAKMWDQYGGVLQAAAATTVVAGMIGTLAYALGECQPYNRTDEMKDTPAGKMTAKVDARKAEHQARAKARTEARGEKQDA